MLLHVIANATAATRVSRVVVAVDDDRLADAVGAAGAEVLRCEEEHATGSDRVGEAVRRLGLGDRVVVNVQGDEPFLSGDAIDAAVTALEDDPGIDVATLATPCEGNEADLPQVVKVVTSDRGRALYFSRAPIPWAEGPVARLKHVGIYAYRPGALARFLAHPPGRHEVNERLEQLRVLEMGLSIGVVEGAFPTIGIDTPDDLARAQARLRAST